MFKHTQMMRWMLLGAVLVKAAFENMDTAKGYEDKGIEADIGMIVF